MSRETERRKPKLAVDDDEEAVLLLLTMLDVAALRGLEMAGDTVVAEEAVA